MTLYGHFALKSGLSSASNWLAFWLSEKTVRKFAELRISETEMGQWVMGHSCHGSNGSPFLGGSRGSRVTASDPLTHDDEITAQ